MSLFQTRHSIREYRQRITTTSTHAQLSPHLKKNLWWVLVCKYFGDWLYKKINQQNSELLTIRYVSGLRYPRSFTRLYRILVQRLRSLLGIHYKER